MANDPENSLRPRVAVIGGGPAGLAAADALAADTDVHVFDAMPSLGRKFLLAGRSGLNITHAEDFARLLSRFGAARETLEPALRSLTPDAIRQWTAGLGIETFVGSSGRVFPTMMKASPLLRAWIARLRECGVNFHTRHRWQGWDAAGALVFATPDGASTVDAAATVLALGGASWPRLGSDAAWTALLVERGIAVRPLRPANCGFDVAWTDHFRERFAGVPMKSVILTVDGQSLRGDCVVTTHGIEGSAVYAMSAALRDAIEARGAATLLIDLAPDRSRERLAEALSRPRGKSSLTNHLRRATGLSPVKLALLRELLDSAALGDAERLAGSIKALPVTIVRTRPIAEAISSAGGVALDELDAYFMLKQMPGIFVAGEMLDWEAPTGGYLLTACLATGRAAGSGAAGWARGKGARKRGRGPVHSSGQQPLK